MVAKRMKCPWGKTSPNLRGVRLTGDQRKWFVQEINDYGKSPVSLANRFHLLPNTVGKWANKVKQGKTLGEGSGRPTTYTPQALKMMKEKMSKSKFAFRPHQVQDMLVEAARNSAEERGVNVAQSGGSKSTMFRASRTMGLVSGTAEATTDARIVACSELRNQVSHAAANNLMVERANVSSLLNINFDGTSFESAGAGADDVEVKYVPAPTKKSLAPSRGLVVEPDPDDKTLTKCYIKYMCIVCAAGLQQAPIYMLADSNMTEEEFRVARVQNMGIGTDITNYGWIVFTKTRAANVAFYKWLFTSAVIPMVNEIKQVYRLPADSKAWVQMDGESVQLQPLFDKNLLSALKEKHIHVGKLPGSTTSINQPCDAVNIFRGPKTQNKKIANKDVKDNKFMRAALDSVFKQHHVWLNSEERGTKRALGKRKKRPAARDPVDLIQMEPAYVKLCILGLLRVQLALQLCMRPHMIRESFKATGIYPFSLEQILNNCHHKITKTEQAAIKAKLPELTELMNQQGEIYETDFDRLGLLCTTVREGKALDELVLNRRRSVIVTHSVANAREVDYITQRDAAKEKAEKKRTCVQLKEGIKLVITK